MAYNPDYLPFRFDMEKPAPIPRPASKLFTSQIVLGACGFGVEKGKAVMEKQFVSMCFLIGIPITAVIGAFSIYGFYMLMHWQFAGDIFQEGTLLMDFIVGLIAPAFAVFCCVFPFGYYKAMKESEAAIDSEHASRNRAALNSRTNMVVAAESAYANFMESCQTREHQLVLFCQLAIQTESAFTNKERIHFWNNASKAGQALAEYDKAAGRIQAFAEKYQQALDEVKGYKNNFPAAPEIPVLSESDYQTFTSWIMKLSEVSEAAHRDDTFTSTLLGMQMNENQKRMIESMTSQNENILSKLSNIQEGVDHVQKVATQANVNSQNAVRHAKHAADLAAQPVNVVVRHR